MKMKLRQIKLNVNVTVASSFSHCSALHSTMHSAFKAQTWCLSINKILHETNSRHDEKQKQILWTPFSC